MGIQLYESMERRWTKVPSTKSAQTSVSHRLQVERCGPNIPLSTARLVRFRVQLNRDGGVRGPALGRTTENRKQEMQMGMHGAG